MDVVTIEGRALHYRDEGPRGGRVIAFANSLGTDLRVWDALMAHLPDTLRTVRYDKRGHGLSDLGETPLSIADLADDMAALLHHLGVSRATIVGLSVGGMIAQSLTARRPDLAEAVVLCDTGHVIGTAEMWNERIAAVEEGGIAAIAGPILERWFSPQFHTGRPGELALWRNMLTRTPQEGYCATASAIRDADLTAAARGIDVPALCVVGTKDGATPPDLVRSLADLIAGSRFVDIEGAGHLPCVEAPAELGRVISGFLKENGLV